MMRIVRRFLAAGSLAGWLGAVVFYGAVVIPTAHEVLGSHREIGFVTRKVTGTLNLLGACSLAFLLWSTLAEAPARAPKHRIALWASWALMLAGQIALFALRARLDGMLEAERMALSDRAAFLWLHERYLNVTSLVCLAGLAHLGLLIAAFGRAEPDR